MNLPSSQFFRLFWVSSIGPLLSLQSSAYHSSMSFLNSPPVSSSPSTGSATSAGSIASGCSFLLEASTSPVMNCRKKILRSEVSAVGSRVLRAMMRPMYS